ncbi:MAG: hypothetical protein WC212_03175 [Candidatus Delongbacteria bacterium]
MGLLNIFKKKEPTEFELLLASAAKHEYNKEFLLAVQDFTKILNLKPDYIDAYSRRASALYNLERYEEALSDENKSISNTDYNEYAFQFRARIHCYLGMYTEAILDLKEIAKYEVENNVIYKMRGLKDEVFLKNKEKLLESLYDMIYAADISEEEGKFIIDRYNKLFF